MAAHEQASGFLLPPTRPEGVKHEERRRAFASESVESKAAEEPIEIGPYRLLRIIGRGGMGVVYEADQLEPVRRRVALKLIRFGSDNREILARFEAERQALALMDHPNIASVFDAGSTSAGTPYFAMEYVDGPSITDFCDREELGLTKRLELFVHVCEGVQHAHQKGIIHRDLKPSNVLVTLKETRPLPKIIDLGVGKAISQRLTDTTLATRIDQLIGTPEYMSPEQASAGEIDIDTRSDVYGLGALLYHLLVGVPPYELPHDLPFHQISRRICEEDPPRPSERIGRRNGDVATATMASRGEAAALRRELRGDLDWVVMKALAKDRDRRYATAAELAEDVSRYLNDEPVIAGPPSRRYRLRKFVRRHRRGITAASIVSVAMVAATASTSVGLLRARRAERFAKREEAKARAVNEFLQEMLGSADPMEGLGKQVTVLEALDAAEAKIDESLKGQPELEAAVRNTVGVTYMQLGRTEDAQRLFEKALEIRLRLFGPEHFEVAESTSELGSVYMEKGDYEKALPLQREALFLYRKLLGTRNRYVANELHNLGSTLFQKGDFVEAESAARNALSIYRQLDGDYRRYIANTIGGLAFTLQRQQRLSEAAVLIQEALDLNRTALGTDHPGVGLLLNTRGSILEGIGDYCSAEGSYRKAAGIFETRVSRHHWWTASAYSNLGRVLTRLGNYEEAESALLRALEILIERFGKEHKRTLRTVRRLARLYHEWEKPDRFQKLHALGLPDNWTELESQDP